MSKLAGAEGVSAALRPSPGISMSSPNGASTMSASSSPAWIRTVFGGSFEIRIRELSSSPLGFGGGGGAVLRGAVVVERLVWGDGRKAAASVETTSSTSITMTSLRAATPVA
jgi:hypothetical protein